MNRKKLRAKAKRDQATGDLVFHLPKKRGGFREIRVPSPGRAAILASYLTRVTPAAVFADRHGVAHGFMPRRSPVTNARQHIGYSISVCFDLADFFGSCRRRHLPDGLRDTRCSEGWYAWTRPRHTDQPWIEVMDGLHDCLPQGYLTSPALSNLCFAATDEMIWRGLQRIRATGRRVAYTRYADDLTFSFDDPRIVRLLLRWVPGVVARRGFALATEKTRIQYARQGRRVITGLSVGQNDVTATRELRRRLRAARHQNNKPQARGMGEWARCHTPEWHQWAIRAYARGVPVETILAAQLHGAKCADPD